MKETAKKLWKWLSGKKSKIATAIMTATQLTEIINPELLPDQIVSILMIVGSSLGGIGLLHAGAKTKKGKEITSKINLRKK